MGGEEPTARLQEATQQHRGQIEWWIRHNVVRPSRQAEIRGVRPNDDDGGAEALAQHPDAASMCLDGDHASASRQQRRRHRPKSGTGIDDERAWGMPASVTSCCAEGVELRSCPAPLCGAQGGGP